MVVAVLALASSAAGAVSLFLATPDGRPMTTPAVGRSFTLDVMLDPGSDSVSGVTFAVATEVSGTLRLTGRAITSTVLTAPITANVDLLATAPIDNATLNPKNGRDIGAGPLDGVSSVPPGVQRIQTLTFTVLSPLPADAHLYVVGPRALQYACWADPDFNSWNLPITSISLTPEPASLALLVCGAGLLVRRRRWIGGCV